MEIKLQFNGNWYLVDLSKPIDISIPLQSGKANPNCFNAPYPLFEPLQSGSFTGDTRMGSPVNFYNIHTNPHGNGTHTECVGHIAKDRFYINDCLKNFHWIGLLITVSPEKIQEDLVITKKQLETEMEKYKHQHIPALMIRTLPNTEAKLTQNYSGNNPPYLTEDAMQYIVSAGFEHLIVDLPSVDREQDEGKLATHHIFWQYPENTRLHATITEMVFIDTLIQNGLYLVNLQIAPVALDASSSKLLLFELNHPESS